MLDAALLGTGGMMPLPGRFLTALMLRLNGNLMLIDCGEGTQITMKMLGWGFKNIDAICFTHYHADHISGLPGLLLTIGNSGRTEPVTLIGPPGLAGVAKSLLVIAPELPFEVYAAELPKDGGLAYTCGEFNISAYPMQHGVPCLGYSVYVGRLPRFDLGRAEALDIPKRLWNLLQKGDTVEHEGKNYTPDMVLGEPRKGIKVSYCTDSRPVAGLADFVRGADLFICEGLYGEDEKLEKAAQRKHMIFREAAEIARDANVKELWLTHYSPALVEPRLFLPNAVNVFKNTKTGTDRLTTTILFEEDSI